MSDWNVQRDVAVGLQIFLAHGGKNFSAEHDQVWAGPADEQATLTADELNRLETAGWFLDSETCGCEGDARIENGVEVGTHADDCNGWSKYV